MIGKKKERAERFFPAGTVAATSSGAGGSGASAAGGAFALGKGRNSVIVEADGEDI
jgi:hypothetical protein